MRLELGIINITDVQLGPSAAIKDGTLYVDSDALVAHLLENEERLVDVKVHLARPGESVRITPVKDVIEPRIKVDSEAEVFPGTVSKVLPVGSGRTHVLRGAAVVTIGKIVGFQEGIVDMCGPGADYTPFSQLNNVVLEFVLQEGLPAHDREQALRFSGLRAAKFLAEPAKDMEPDEVTTYETLPLMEGVKRYPDLPRVAYLQMLQSQGLLHDTYVYGVDAKQILPTLIHPTELMDGAIISGNCVSACDKNTTYHHQNNPVVADLFAKHGEELQFVGVIITNENVFLDDKVRSSDWSAKLAEYLSLDGIIISQEGFGNPDTDLILNAKKIEALGIPTVIITDEYAGTDGASQSLADADPSADAVVTGGNANEIVILPKLDRVIGDINVVTVIAGGSDKALREDGSLEVELQAITGATNELGFGKLTTKGY